MSVHADDSKEYLKDFIDLLHPKQETHIDEIGERYRLNDAIDSKPYTQFPRNVCPSRHRIATFSGQ